MVNVCFSFFFLKDAAPPEISSLSLPAALPISRALEPPRHVDPMARPCERCGVRQVAAPVQRHRDRKSTRLNSSHANISYAVFCLKKKNIHYIAPLCHNYFCPHSVYILLPSSAR